MSSGSLAVVTPGLNFCYNEPMMPDEPDDWASWFDEAPEEETGVVILGASLPPKPPEK